MNGRMCNCDECSINDKPEPTLEELAQENISLRQQVLELSAMVEKMRGVIQVVADNPPADDADGVPAYCAEFLASISPAEALREHDNEVAAKALEEEAFEFESANEGYSSRFVEVQDLVCMLRNVAEERRNKK